MENSNGGAAWDNVTPTDTIWEKANDPSPAGWRVPTFEELQSLLDTDNVSHTWTTVDGVTGRQFTDKITGYSIFLPATGSRNYNNGVLSDEGILGSYWSSRQDDGSYGAYFLFFTKDRALRVNHYPNYGFNVRSVAENLPMNE